MAQTNRLLNLVKMKMKFGKRVDPNFVRQKYGFVDPIAEPFAAKPQFSGLAPQLLNTADNLRHLLLKSRGKV